MRLKAMLGQNGSFPLFWIRNVIPLALGTLRVQSLLKGFVSYFITNNISKYASISNFRLLFSM
jgi:hypothetical protein